MVGVGKEIGQWCSVHKALQCGIQKACIAEIHETSRDATSIWTPFQTNALRRTKHTAWRWKTVRVNVGNRNVVLAGVS